MWLLLKAHPCFVHTPCRKRRRVGIPNWCPKTGYPSAMFDPNQITHNTMTIPFTIVGDIMATRQPLYFSSTNKWIKYDQMGGSPEFLSGFAHFKQHLKNLFKVEHSEKKRRNSQCTSDFVGQVADTTDDLQGMTREVGDEETCDLSGVWLLLVGRDLENLQETSGKDRKSMYPPVNWKWSLRPILGTSSGYQLFFSQVPEPSGVIAWIFLWITSSYTLQ